MRHRKYLTGVLIVILLTALGSAAVFFVPKISQRNAPEEKINTQPTKVKRQKISSNPTYQAFLREGDSAAYKTDFAAALTAYQKASEIEPREALPYEKIGDVYFSQKNYSAARQNFELALSLNPSNGAISIKIVRSVLGMRKIIDAKIILEKIEPKTQASLYYEGLIAAFLNEQEKTKERLAQSITSGADESLQNNANKLLALYKEFEVSRDAKIEYLQVILAQFFDSVGEYGLAIELAFDALKTQHNYRDAWIVLGHAFLNEEKWLDAQDALKKALELDASNPAAFFFRGVAEQRLEKTKEAIADFEQALKFGWQPRLQALQELADGFFALKDFEKAFPLYKEVVTVDPTDINRFVRPIALAINHLGKPKEAQALAEKAYRSHPDSAFAHNLLGWAAIANNDLENAHQHLEEALNLDSELAAAYLNLGQLAEIEKNKEEALAHYQKAIELAEKQKNSDIAETAKARYNGVNEQEIKMPLTPLPQQKIPSLSLE